MSDSVAVADSVSDTLFEFLSSEFVLKSPSLPLYLVCLSGTSGWDFPRVLIRFSSDFPF